jgi:hypothetical protein
VGRYEMVVGDDVGHEVAGVAEHGSMFGVALAASIRACNWGQR